MKSGLMSASMAAQSWRARSKLASSTKNWTTVSDSTEVSIICLMHCRSLVHACKRTISLQPFSSFGRNQPTMKMW
eukprot:3253955-Pyramimonas_sp.AAC.1